METVEIIVYFSVAIIAGGLVVGFISDWQYWDVFDFLKEEQGIKEFEEVSREEFVGRLSLILEQCREDQETIAANYYVKGSGDFSKAELFAVIKALKWCNSIQSKEHDCGAREDVTFNRKILLPQVVTVECRENKLYLG